MNDHPSESQQSQRIQPKLQFVVSTIIILATLYIARGFLLPVFAALLLSYALIPIVRMLTAIRVPRVIAAFIVVGVFFFALLYSIFALSGPAMAWLERAPESFNKLENLSHILKRPVENVNAATEQLNRMTESENGSKRPMVVRIEKSNIFELILSQTPIVIGASLSTLILLYFLLAFGNILLLRIVEISPRLRDKRRAVETARDVESCVSRYLLTVTLINASLGICVGLSLYLLGFKNPILWGTLAAAFNYIPYIGAFCGVGLLALASLGTTDNVGLALTYPGIYLILTLIEGNFITPMVLGQFFTINPIFIVLVLLFLGWLWGIPGALMAVPMLVAVKSAANSFDTTRPLATILSK